MAYKVLILNGPNLNWLGKREPDIYGGESFDEVFPKWQAKFPNFNLHYFQSNWEGGIIDKIQEVSEAGFQSIIINAGGYTHTSVAIADALRSVSIKPIIEVHISHILAREPFRHISLLAPATHGMISGFGLDGYVMALKYVEDYLKLNP